MTLDDLKGVWKEEMGRPVRVDALSMRVLRRDVAKFDRAVRFRDFFMIFGLGFCALISAMMGWLAEKLGHFDSLSCLGVLAYLVLPVVAVIALLRARRVTRSDDWTLRARFETEIERLEKQRRLLDHIGYWFILPLSIATILSSLGGFHTLTGRYLPDARGWALYASCGAVYGFTYWSVRREAREKWAPLLARLRGLLADLSSTENVSDA